MCGRYSLAAPDPDELRKRFGIGTPSETLTQLKPRYNIAPTQRIVAVTAAPEPDTEADPAHDRRVRVLRWGLVPPFMKDTRGGARMINARAETAAEKNSFRASLKKYRCLIPADGFYEWARPENGPKQPYYISVPAEPLFSFAGLWATWHRGQEDELASATILTTAANAAMATIHERMPVILTPEQEQLWLDPETPAELIQELMRGLPAEALSLCPVGTAVNNARHDGPDCLLPAPPPTPDPRRDARPG